MDENGSAWEFRQCLLTGEHLVHEAAASEWLETLTRNLDWNQCTFDLVCAYSVFCHLSNDVTLPWMGEFERVLKPGGFLVFTTRPESFLGFCSLESTRARQDPYLRASVSPSRASNRRRRPTRTERSPTRRRLAPMEVASVTGVSKARPG